MSIMLHLLRLRNCLFDVGEDFLPGGDGQVIGFIAARGEFVYLALSPVLRLQFQGGVLAFQELFEDGVNGPVCRRAAALRKPPQAFQQGVPVCGAFVQGAQDEETGQAHVDERLPIVGVFQFHG